MARLTLSPRMQLVTDDEDDPCRWRSGALLSHEDRGKRKQRTSLPETDSPVDAVPVPDER